MDCHQILSGACNVGDKCFAIGSVEGINFTVSGFFLLILLLTFFTTHTHTHQTHWDVWLFKKERALLFSLVLYRCNYRTTLLGRKQIYNREDEMKRKHLSFSQYGCSIWTENKSATKQIDSHFSRGSRLYFSVLRIGLCHTSLISFDFCGNTIYAI